MQEYTSKTVRIQRDPSQIFASLADMSLFAKAIPADQVKEIKDIQATPDTCLFKVKGVEVGIQIINREPYKTIKYTGYGATPFEFLLWIQLKEVAAYDTRMRIVLHVNLNMMMKMMLKGKIQKGLDNIAEQLANGMNGHPITPPNIQSIKDELRKGELDDSTL